LGAFVFAEKIAAKKFLVLTEYTNSGIIGQTRGTK
jgi:hypothetical protein